jgi:hypothetical protein
MFTLDSSFVRLESLGLYGLTPHKLVPLLIGLISLPRLFSLSIDLNDSLKRKSAVYRLIFRLPVLKYGKFFLESKHELSDLTIPDNNQHETSPIEYFITNAYCRLHQFAALLSYTPQLRHFSCAYLSAHKSQLPKLLITPVNLTRVYIDDCLLSFGQFESFVAKFCLRLKLLRLSVRRNDSYLDANRWQRLISFHIPDLKTFDFEHVTWIDNNEALDIYHAQIDQFNTSFWHQRKWFFVHQHHARYTAGTTKFYSTQPYRYERLTIEFSMSLLSLRRSIYEVFERVVGDTCLRRETGLNFAKRIIIHGKCIDPNYSIQYPYATALSLCIYSTQGKAGLMSYLNCNIHLEQITQLYIDGQNLDEDNLIKILYDMPNVDYLSFYHKPLLKIASRSADQEKQMTNLAIKSKITKLESAGVFLYTLDEIKRLISFCPRLEYLEIDFGEDMLEWIASDLLTKKTTPHMFSCCFWNATRVMMGKLEKNIDQMTNIHNNYFMQFINVFCTCGGRGLINNIVSNS